MRVGVAMLKEFREFFRLVGTEPDDGTWLTPWLFERVPHVTDNRLGWRVSQTLERSPSLPCSFQARSCVLCARDLLWITHRAPPLYVFRPLDRTGPSAASAWNTLRQ
jgi:hypothetical protein